jgi:2,4-dienoyl-CoA reductase-like NADH-dependent reductase (Old Yellow Enzyme family)
MSMTELGPGETLSDANIAFYERLARGGAAVVTIGESIIPTQNGKTHKQMLMLGNPEIHASLVRVVDAIHAHGALADIEISHGGYMADPVYNNGRNLIGPVALHDDYAGNVLGMDETMLNDVADAFADATETVMRLGFDRVARVYEAIRDGFDAGFNFCPVKN